MSDELFPSLPVRVLAPNPGPFTLEGTNTWIVGREPTLVIDPGPDDHGHLLAVRRQAEPIAAVLLTHRHLDHAPGAAELAREANVPVFAFAPVDDEERLVDGQTFPAGGVQLTAVHTPGHTPDHVAFHDAEGGVLFTGDAVLGRGTSVIDPPDGDLADYLASLERMARLRPRTILPGHGPAVWSAEAKLAEYQAHRLEREGQVLRALERGPSTPTELVQDIYAGYPPSLHPAAARSVLAHLLKLEREGRVSRAGDEVFASTRPHDGTT